MTMTANQQKLYRLVEQAKDEAAETYEAQHANGRATAFVFGQECAFKAVLNYLQGDPFPLKVWAGKLKQEG